MNNAFAKDGFTGADAAREYRARVKLDGESDTKRGELITRFCEGDSVDKIKDKGSKFAALPAAAPGDQEIRGAG